MDEDLKFKDTNELYNKVMPALFSKVKETRRLGLKYISEKDIWNYLTINEWTKRNDLQLYDLISDILAVDNYALYDYVLENMKSLKDKEDIILNDVSKGKGEENEKIN